MGQKPVVDLLFEAILNGDSQQFDAITETRASECVDIRTLFSTIDPTAIDLDMELGVQSNDCVTSIFEGPRAWMLSRHTAIQSHLTGGQANVLVDYSLGFDSNFAEKLRALIAGENINPTDRERVTGVMKLKASNSRVQFDVQPFVNENTRFDREQPGNERPLNTLTAFYMLDHLDWRAFLADSTQLKFDIPPEELRSRLKRKASEYLKSQHSDASVLKQEAMAMGTEALLWRFACLWKTHKRDQKSILRDLLDFCLFELGQLPISELTLIWRGTIEKQPARFFGPVINPSKDMIKDLRGMAWDMTHLRSLQNVATKSMFGSFFIPYFVSMDARWKELLQLNPIRVVLIDDAKCSANFGRSRDVEFQTLINEVMSTRAKAEMTPEKVEKRRVASRSIDRRALAQLVEQERLAWA